MNIIEAIENEQLFKPCFKPSLDSWQSWITLLKAIFALKLTETELSLYRKCTGRETAPDKPIRNRGPYVDAVGGSPISQPSSRFSWHSFITTRNTSALEKKAAFKL